jgi:hypothetical protein
VCVDVCKGWVGIYIYIYIYMKIYIYIYMKIYKSLIKLSKVKVVCVRGLVGLGIEKIFKDWYKLQEKKKNKK